MDIFTYNPKTGVYIGIAVADPHPILSDVWLVPAFATATPPPDAPDGQVAVFGDDGWQLMPAPPQEFGPQAPVEDIADMPPAPTPTNVSFWQFLRAAKAAGFITHAEAMAALQQRVMPAVFANALSGLPQSAQEDAEIKFAGITRVQRADPLFDLLLAAEVVTPAQLDAVFTAAAQIT